MIHIHQIFQNSSANMWTRRYLLLSLELQRASLHSQSGMMHTSEALQRLQTCVFLLTEIKKSSQTYLITDTWNLKSFWTIFRRKNCIWLMVSRNLCSKFHQIHLFLIVIPCLSHSKSFLLMFGESASQNFLTQNQTTKLSEFEAPKALKSTLLIMLHIFLHLQCFQCWKVKMVVHLWLFTPSIEITEVAKH